MFEEDAFPYIYEIEPTNACPYKCYMCPRGKGKMERPVGFMPLKSFESILNQIPPQQKMLRLHHFGEPILHPEISTFIKLTRSARIIPALSLNPSSLTKDIIDSLIDSGVGIVCFSLDSLDSQRLHDIRGITRPVEYCLEMIDYFIKESRGATQPVFKIIQMVSLLTNRDEQSSFLSIKERYPEEDVHVYISPNYGFGDIELVMETNEDGISGLKSSDSVCSAPFDDIVVLWNGDVVLCCYDYDGFNVVGNINDNTIESIWRGNSVRDIRRAFRNRKTDRLTLCSRCYLAPHNHPEDEVRRLRRGLTEEEYILNLYPPFKN